MRRPIYLLALCSARGRGQGAGPGAADLLPLPVLGENPQYSGARAGGRGSAARGAKYGLLFVIAFAALWGNLTLLVLDPLTLFIRGITTPVLPGSRGLSPRRRRSCTALPARGALLTFDRRCAARCRATNSPSMGGCCSPRCWAASWRSGWWRDAPGAATCAHWAQSTVSRRGRHGSSGASRRLRTSAAPAREPAPWPPSIPPRGYTSDGGECILCLDCADACPKGAISVRRDMGRRQGYAYDPSADRRWARWGSACRAGAAKDRAIKPPPRCPPAVPPGADEAQPAACVRCGACLRVCPTHGLQPSLTEAGLEGLWTPILVPRLGACDYSCTACGEACPTGAIPPLAPEAKRLTAIGKAYVDPARCIPWSGRAECIVCEEMCPLPQKAITPEIVRAGCDGSGARAAGAGGGPRALHRLRDVRDQVPGERGGGHPRHRRPHGVRPARGGPMVRR